MAVDATYDPHGLTFIPQVIRDPAFQRKGYLTGQRGTYYYAAINPNAHAIYVWRKTGTNNDSYVASAKALNVAVFTNGPMMTGVSSTIFKDTITGATIGTLVLGLVGAKVGGGWGAFFGAVVGVFVGGYIGWKVAWNSIFNNAKPYGPVLGTKNGINDPGSGDDANLAYFGRGPVTTLSGTFSSYKIAKSPVAPAASLPPGLAEVICALVPLVLNYVGVSANPASPNFNQGWEGLERGTGACAWALIPISTDPTKCAFPKDTFTLEEGQVIDGVLFTIASADAALNKELISLLTSIGTRDAVAVDGSDSVVLGSLGEVFVGPPPWYKDRWQQYGFYVS